jgi:aryl-alcohol dehydrogenase-like predicted oxidoreductase
VEYRNLGRSGLRVGVISIGGWLNFGGRLDAAGTARVLDAAFDAGINHVDLADVYADGEAERQVGQWLTGRQRDSVVVASKAFWPTGDGPNDRGLSRKHLVASVHGALRRLQTDHVDLFYCHREDETTRSRRRCGRSTT